MGSTGTVAYSEESDFDIWLCHEADLNDGQRNKLRRKAEAVASWVSSLELEVHFFLVDANALRDGEIGRLSSEGSGSTQHHLLLDEFYRTGLCIAGQYPLWWLVPPEKESDYEEYVTEIKRKRFPYAKGHIDFGGLANIPAEEFFGAALWQLYKGIDAPYKSVLKLLLTEIYAREYPHVAPLSLRSKQMVYDGEGIIDRLDPYRMMLEKVESYLKPKNDTQRLELARRCFYFKVDENSQLTEIYVLDENGSLYFQQRPFYNDETLLLHFSHFFENITNRMGFLMHEGQAANTVNGVEFHAIKRDARGKRVLYQERFPQQGAAANYIKLLVIVELNELGKTNFVLYCNNREFPALEYGTGLFDAIAGYMLSLRDSGFSYPIYITDISISRPALTEAKISRVQTRHFLTYKQRIEDQLNHAMKRLDSDLS